MSSIRFEDSIRGKIYNIWRCMQYRCYDPEHENYKYYGGNGITVCDEWRNDFEKFYSWALDNNFSVGLTIDRIINKIGYCPTNCKFSTRIEQSRNKTNNRFVTIFNESKCIAEWIEDKRCKVNKHTLIYRLEHGWNAECALTTKSRYWTKEEIKFVSENFKKMKYKDISKIIWKTETAIRVFISKNMKDV